MPQIKQNLLAFLQSIRFRLVMWFAFILALVLLAFSSFIYFSQLRDIIGETSFRMERRLDDVLRLSVIVDGKIILPDGFIQPGEVVVFLDSNGQSVASVGAMPAEEVAEILASSSTDQARRESTRLLRWESENGEHYTFFSRKMLNLDGNVITLVLGSPFDTYGLISRLVFTLVAGSIITLAVALAGGFWLADRAMRPVRIITQTAHELGETDLSRRLNLKSKDELGELANTFDAMLDRLETAFQRQRQFVADASHELRTPLTIVNLEAGRALNSKRTANEYQRTLTVIQQESSLMTRMVNDLLILARMDNGQIRLEKERVDLSDIALDAVERLSPLATRHGVQLETGDLPEAFIQGNRQYLLQMVSNLIENGIKYSGSGDDRFVRVETGLDELSAWVRVSDNGPGIPAESLPHIFDRFYRADKARSRNDDVSSGSGLGLSIVQSIARTHGGRVLIQTREGEGAAFEVRFG